MKPVLSFLRFHLPLLCSVALPLLTARAQTPGDQDSTFATGPEADNSAFALALQPNGQVLVGGSFGAFRGKARNGIARLNPSGSLDSFSPGLALSAVNGQSGPPTVKALALQANGQVLATGAFTVLGQRMNGGVVRLNADGSLDGTFNAGVGVGDDGDAVGSGLALAVLPGGQILVGGGFLTFNGVSHAGLVRLNANGSVDTTFNPGGAGITGNGYGFNGGDVSSIAVLANGQIYIGGHFNAYNGHAAGSVARLNANGTLDATFNVGEGAGTGINAVAVQANGQVLAGGSSTFDGVSVPNLVRLNTDGSLDTSYNPAGGLNIDGVDAILVQPDGSALVGGAVYIPQGLIDSPGDGLIRILADGTQDPDFDSGGSQLETTALALQPDGKALIAANVFALTGVATGDVYRVYDLIPTPTATVVSGAKKVYESGSKGPATFVVSLSAAPTMKTVIKYVLKGSAVSGVDYEPLTGKVKIKPGHTSATVSVDPIDGGNESGGVVTIKLQLEPGSGYTVGTPGLAKDKIIDNH